MCVACNWDWSRVHQRSVEFDEKFLVGNRLSFRMIPSKSRLSFSNIEIIALNGKLLFDKNTKKGNFCWKLFGMCISNSKYA